MVVTMLEARVSEDGAARLVEEFSTPQGGLPPVILESFLLQEDGGDRWRIVTVWSSREALADYRASVETPEGVRMFRAAGAEPSLTVFDVAAHAAQP